MPNEKTLQDAVAETAAVVADWRRSAASISTQLNVAGLALARAKKAREAHALKSASGDATAIAAIKSARAEQLAAEQTIDDLKIALPEAEAQLGAAEKNAVSAENALAKFNAEVLKRKRIEVAGDLDQIIANLVRVYGEYEKLGREIVNMDVIPQSAHLTTNYDSALGDRRVRAALPKLFERVYPNALHDETKKESLSKSESRYWFGEPPVETTTTKAA
jgi:hypothetical protein